MKIAFIVSQYHAFVTDGLERGAREALHELGMDTAACFVVPGAFELAPAASRVAATGQYDAIVCLGCLIRGETAHFDYIAQAASHGIMRAGQTSGVPVSFGLLTTNTADEALARSSPGEGNKGREAALAAVAMARLYASLGTSA